MKADEIDSVIIDLLEQNGRLSASAISKVVRLTDTAVRNRIARLETLGVILGYRAVLGPEAPNRSPLALIEVTLGLASYDALKRFERGAASLPGLISFEQSSPQNYVLRLRQPAPAEMITAIANSADVEIDALHFRVLTPISVTPQKPPSAKREERKPEMKRRNSAQRPNRTSEIEV
jgi:DNA-binding Lrp family transcriptional regulator